MVHLKTNVMIYHNHKISRSIHEIRRFRMRIKNEEKK
jgi:hypothetical protein